MGAYHRNHYFSYEFLLIKNHHYPLYNPNLTNADFHLFEKLVGYHGKIYFSNVVEVKEMIKAFLGIGTETYIEAFDTYTLVKKFLSNLSFVGNENIKI